MRSRKSILNYSKLFVLHILLRDRIGGVLALNVVDRGLEPGSGQTKDYKMGICCFPANHAALRRKNKDWLARTVCLSGERLFKNSTN
jgi:hypothetical protein